MTEKEFIKEEKEVEIIKEAFMEEYMQEKLWSGYVNVVSMGKRDAIESLTCGGRTGVIRKQILDRGENPDELCIWVGLRHLLPEGLHLPQMFRGVRVYTSFIGEIKAYK